MTSPEPQPGPAPGPSHAQDLGPDLRAGRPTRDPGPGRPVLDLGVDRHVATTFSDGRMPLTVAAARATARGLRELTIADHVGRESQWFDAYVAAVRAADAVCGVRLRCALEVGLLDPAGRLDLPAGVRTRLSHVDHVVLAPIGAAAWERPGTRLPAEQVLEDVLLASLRAAATLPVPVVLAAPFAVLAGCGLDERDVPDATLRELGWALAAADTAVQVSERWRSPSVRTARLLAAAGVRLVAASGARTAAEIGRWEHVATVAAALAVDGTGTGTGAAAGPPAGTGTPARAGKTDGTRSTGSKPSP